MKLIELLLFADNGWKPRTDARTDGRMLTIPMSPPDFVGGDKYTGVEKLTSPTHKTMEVSAPYLQNVEGQGKLSQRIKVGQKLSVLFTMVVVYLFWLTNTI